MKRKAKSKKPKKAPAKKSPPKTDAEIAALAEAIYKGQIFTDRHLHNPKSDMTLVFVALALTNLRTVIREFKAMTGEPVGMVYEYLNKAGPVGVNGMPMFFSCSFLTQSEATRVWAKYDAIKRAVDFVTKP